MNAIAFTLSQAIQNAAETFAPILLDVAIKATVLLVLAATATALCRRAAASTRHLLWTAAVFAMLVSPLLYVVLPT